MTTRLVAAKAKLRLKLQRWHADGMTGDDVRGKKLRSQRQMAAVYHRSSRHGCLPCATGTFLRIAASRVVNREQQHTNPRVDHCAAAIR